MDEVWTFNTGWLVLSSWATSCTTKRTTTRAIASPPPITFDDNFYTHEERIRYERFYAKRKIQDIHTIKMADFVEAKFKYLMRFEKFKWMPYLTTQYPIHENHIQVFFSNATMKQAGEHD